MNGGCLRVARAGPGATVQDGGRHGHLRYGVTPAGAMDWTAFRTANRALGNAAEAAATEISVGGLDAVCEAAPLAVAFCGGGFAWSRDGAALPAAASILLQPGQTLSARAGAWGAWTYLAVEGGLDTPVAMGSRSTHVRSGIGGIEGRMLREGDLLPAFGGDRGPAGAPAEMGIAAPWLGRDDAPLRVVLGPQDDYFSGAGLATFTEATFILSPAADRMAYRMDGPKIEHSRGFNIVSDGIALGGIQIAGDGHPIVMMADRGPSGGYPKIGTVIRADLGRLAQMRPGETCRFAVVDVDVARAALLALEDEVGDIEPHLHPLRPELTAERLLGLNLVGGVVDALTPP